MTLTSASSQEPLPLAKLVEHYWVFWHELAAATDREQQAVLSIRWRACWNVILVVLASSALTQEQLKTLVGLYLVLRREQATYSAAMQHEFLRAQLRACWEEIQAMLAAQPIADEQLLTLVNLYQILQYEQATPSAPIPQELLRSYLHTTCDMIWVELAESLTQLAYSWLRSGLAKNLLANPASYASRADAVQTLKLLAFAQIIRQLPALNIHPRKNVRAYLIKIAYWGLYNENGLYNPAGPGGARKSPASPDVIAPGTPAAAMWSTVERLPMPAEDDFNARTQEDIYDQQCITALRNFIAHTCSAADQLILERRWQEPPIEHTAIAAELGSGWDETRVRVRHHRALNKIRAYIEARVLVAMRDQQCAAEVWALVQRALEPSDQTILRIRWRTHPPVDFASIAAELGASWTETQVRKRHQHAMAYIFAHVRSLGLVDLR
jgi:hypothetical protein